MVRNVLGKVSRKSGNCRISESDPFQQKLWKFRTENENGTDIPGKKFSKISANLTKLSFFPEIPENVVAFFKKIQVDIFDRMESTPGFLAVLLMMMKSCLVRFY